MTFVPNPNFENEIRAQMQRMQKAIADVSSEYSGRPLAEVAAALQQRVAGVGDGASIDGPELMSGAQLISSGKRLWLTDDGRLMGED